MSKHACVICYLPLTRAQRTCGSAECLDTWRNINSKEGRAKRINLATYTPSERALILQQGPSPEEEAEKAERIQQLQEDLAEYQKPKQDLTPQFIRDALNPDNLLKPKKEGDE